MSAITNTSVLISLFSNVIPRKPFDKELTSYPQRCFYWEPSVVTTVLSFSFTLCNLIRHAVQHAFNKPSEKWLLAAEFMFLSLPLQIGVLDYPVPTYYIFDIYFFIFSSILIVLLTTYFRFSKRQKDYSYNDNHLDKVIKSSSRNEIFTLYRGCVYLSTAVCIFARDLPTWNNLFSKSFNFGTGLMDVGIGCFVVIIGTMAPTIRQQVRHIDSKSVIQRMFKQVGLLCVCGVVHTIIHLVPLLILTGSTLVLTDSHNEYGVHWNAFFSLAAAKCFGTLLELHLSSKVPPIIYGYGIGILYEIILANGLATVIFSNNRSNILYMNKEGLSSVFGICSLYFFGMQIGKWAHQWNNNKTRYELLNLCGKLLTLLLACVSYHCFLYFHTDILLPESRRLFNLSYIHWILVFSIISMLLSAASIAINKAVQGPLPISLYISHIDVLGLVYFITANLSTGLLNGVIYIFYSNRENMQPVLCFLILQIHMALTYLSAIGITKLVAKVTASRKKSVNNTSLSI